MENLSKVFQNKQEKKHKEIEFHNNSIQDWVFASVYRFSAWKNACTSRDEKLFEKYLRQNKKMVSTS